MSWESRGVCAQPTFNPAEMDTSLVDSRGRVSIDKARATAERTCARCPVLAHCRALADELDANGLTPQEMVLAGWWFPAANAAGKAPIYLLDDARIEAAA